MIFHTFVKFRDLIYLLIAYEIFNTALLQWNCQLSTSRQNTFIKTNTFIKVTLATTDNMKNFWGR